MLDRDDVFLAYTAGFFDADGSVMIGIRKNKKGGFGGSFSLDVNIVQAEYLDIFDEWQNRWGGTLTRHKYTKRRGGFWIWTPHGPKAAAFLADIFPFLRKKQDQAQVALAFQSEKERTRGQQLSEADSNTQKEMFNSIKQLKKAVF